MHGSAFLSPIPFNSSPPRRAPFPGKVGRGFRSAHKETSCWEPSTSIRAFRLNSLTRVRTETGRDFHRHSQRALVTARRLRLRRRACRRALVPPESAGDSPSVVPAIHRPKWVARSCAERRLHRKGIELRIPPASHIGFGGPPMFGGFSHLFRLDARSRNRPRGR